MRVRFLAACAAAALAAPALASAQPNRFEMVTTVAPGDRATMTIGTVPKGEFGFSLRAASDGAKAFRLTQKRNGGAAFTVVRSSGPTASACEGAAGSLICTGITTPATPAGRRWTFALTNSGDRPLAITLRITWRPVPNAG